MGDNADRYALWISLAALFVGISGATWWLRRALTRALSPSEAHALTKAFAGFSLVSITVTIFLSPFGLLCLLVTPILNYAALSFALWISRREEAVFQER